MNGSSSSPSFAASAQKSKAEQEVAADLKQLVADSVPPPPLPFSVEKSGPEWLVPENPKARQMVYLIACSALVPKQADNQSTGSVKDASAMSRQDICDAMLDAISDPIFDAKAGGRPRKAKLFVEKMIVFRERHENGKFHSLTPFLHENPRHETELQCKVLGGRREYVGDGCRQQVSLLSHPLFILPLHTFFFCFPTPPLSISTPFAQFKFCGGCESRQISTRS